MGYTFDLSVIICDAYLCGQWRIDTSEKNQGIVRRAARTSGFAVSAAVCASDGSTRPRSLGAGLVQSAWATFFGFDLDGVSAAALAEPSFATCVT